MIDFKDKNWNNVDYGSIEEKINKTIEARKKDLKIEYNKTTNTKDFQNDKWIGILTACVSPKAYELIKDEFKALTLPYGFKLNAFNKIPDNYVVTSADSWGTDGNPNKILGTNKNLTEKKFYSFVKNYMKEGATILGGCCEIKPSHIKEISKLVN